MADKVFGTILMAQDGQRRAIVQCRSRNAAADAFGLTQSAARDFMSTTGNAAELAAAAIKPGTVFWRPLNKWGAPYVERAQGIVTEGEDPQGLRERSE